MPTTFQAVAVLLVALLPGAIYVWSFERIAGGWGLGLSDRVLRFIGASSVLHVIAAPLTYWFWSTQWSKVLDASSDATFWWWAAAASYVLVPFGLGTLVGFGSREKWPAAKLVTGPDPEPRAWDHLFQGKQDGWIRLRLKSDTWIAGAFADSDGRKSYSAGYPHPQDLFMARGAQVDPDTGDFVFGDDGAVQLLDGGILVRWEEVEYLEFIDV
jgi:hypothetical protein